MADPKLNRHRMLLYPGFAFHVSDNIQVIEPIQRTASPRTKRRADYPVKSVAQKTETQPPRKWSRSSVN